MRAAIAAFEEGRTDNEVAAAGYETMIAGGSETMCLDPIVTVGEWSGVPHSTHCRRDPPGRPRSPRNGGLHPSLHSEAPKPPSWSLAGRATTSGGAAEACITSLNTCIEHMKPGEPAGDIALGRGPLLGGNFTPASFGTGSTATHSALAFLPTGTTVRH